MFIYNISFPYTDQMLAVFYSSKKDIVFLHYCSSFKNKRISINFLFEESAKEWLERKGWDSNVCI